MGQVEEDPSRGEVSEMVPEPRGEAAAQPCGGEHGRGRSGRCKGPEVDVTGWVVHGPKGRPPGAQAEGAPPISLRGLVGPGMELGLILSAGGSAPDTHACKIPLAALGREVELWRLRAVRRPGFKVVSQWCGGMRRGISDVS